MNRTYLLVFLMMLVAGVAFAAAPKVDVCHVPPGNPQNFHTIRISQAALAAHLAHGDLLGPCNDLCAELCDDGNACTIDDTGDCELVGCPVTPVPVDCSDGSLCTEDLCDPVSGCSNPPAVICTPPDLCTITACDPLTGLCEDTPVACPEGEECDLDTGFCESTAACPCWTPAEIHGLRYIAEGDYTPCRSGYNDPSGNPIGQDDWQIERIITTHPRVWEYNTRVITLEWLASTNSPSCNLFDDCNDGSCLDETRFSALTQEEYEVCNALLRQAGRERGFGCFQ